STAVKERPAPPSWADTLSAPAPPVQDPEQQGPVTETEEPRAEESGTAPAPVEPELAETTPPPSQATAPPTTGEPPPPAAAPPAEPEPAAAATSAPEETAAPEDSGQPPAVIDRPEAPGDRMVRLRERLSRSGSIGRGILNLLTRGSIDEDTWDEIEETLLL